MGASGRLSRFTVSSTVTDAGNSSFTKQIIDERRKAETALRNIVDVFG